MDMAGEVTQAMINAARRAEYEYQKGRGLRAARFVPRPDAVIRVMLEAGLGAAIVGCGTLTSLVVVVAKAVQKTLTAIQNGTAIGRSTTTCRLCRSPLSVSVWR
jgi:hypothetical protein